MCRGRQERNSIFCTFQASALENHTNTPCLPTQEHRIAGRSVDNDGIDPSSSLNESFDPSSVRRPRRGVALTILNGFAPTQIQQAIDWREKKPTDEWMAGMERLRLTLVLRIRDVLIFLSNALGSTRQGRCDWYEP